MKAEKRLERFWERVDRSDGLFSCWTWHGAIYTNGYGRFGATAAHRFAYEAFVGPIPAGHQIDHLCRVILCVNPGHLEPVTQQENLKRHYDFAGRPTHCPKGHVYNEVNTVWQNGRGRSCRLCRLEHSRNWKARQAALVA